MTLSEDDDIYPQNICSACRLRLTRFRKSGHGSISFCVAPEFVSHSSEFCRICDFKSGRPQKQRKRKLSVIVSDLNSDTDSAPESSLNESSCAENLNDSSCLDNLNDSCHASDTDNFLAVSSSVDTSLADNSEADNLTLNGLSLDTLDDSCNFGDVVIDSLSVERFIDTQIAKAFICTICRGVPFEPVVSCCNHIFCSNCIKGWLSVSSACPVCRNCIDETDIIMPLSGNLLFIYESLQVKCSHSQCNLKISLKNVKFHAKVFDVNKPYSSKLPLDQVSTKHIKHRRLKPVINSVQQKVKTKLMFFFLY